MVLYPEVARRIFHLDSPTLDLSATSLDMKLRLYCSLVTDPMALMEDSFSHPWIALEVFAFLHSL